MAYGWTSVNFTCDAVGEFNNLSPVGPYLCESDVFGASLSDPFPFLFFSTVVGTGQMFIVTHKAMEPARNSDIERNLYSYV